MPLSSVRPSQNSSTKGRRLAGPRHPDDSRATPGDASAPAAGAAEILSMRFATAPQPLWQGVSLSQVFWRSVAEAAYFKAEKRGFVSGFEIDDWLQAEQETRSAME